MVLQDNLDLLDHQDLEVRQDHPEQTASPEDQDLRVHEVRPAREDHKVSVVNQVRRDNQGVMDDQVLKVHVVKQDHRDQVDKPELRVQEENAENQAYR